MVVVVLWVEKRGRKSEVGEDEWAKKRDGRERTRIRRMDDERHIIIVIKLDSTRARGGGGGKKKRRATDQKV